VATQSVYFFDPDGNQIEFYANYTGKGKSCCSGCRGTSKCEGDGSPKELVILPNENNGFRCLLLQLRHFLIYEDILNLKIYI